MSTIDSNTTETPTGTSQVFPDQIMIQLAGIADTCREGLLAVAVQAGLATMQAIMAEEATGLCGDWNARHPDRRFQRGGTTPTSVTLGGQRVPTRRPRVRTIDHEGNAAGEAQLETYTHFADTDLLTRVVTERMLAGVATRDFTRVSEPIGDDQRATARSTSKSAVSRRFVTGAGKALDDLLHRDLTAFTPVVLMLDGIVFASQATVVALVVTAEGKKIPVGIAHGDTENTVVVEGLLRSMLDGTDVGFV